jgi:hypothetical protein
MAKKHSTSKKHGKKHHKSAKSAKRPIGKYAAFVKAHFHSVKAQHPGLTFGELQPKIAALYRK